MDNASNERAGFVCPRDGKLYPGLADRYNDRRFAAAVAAMQGDLASQGGDEQWHEASFANLAVRAVKIADALLAELAK